MKVLNNYKKRVIDQGGKSVKTRGKKQALLFIVMCCILMINTVSVCAAEKSEQYTKEILKELEPKLIIESYEIVDGQMAKGEEFTIQIKVRNTNLYANAFNVITTFTLETDNVRLIDTTANQKYDAAIPAGQIVAYEYQCEVMDHYDMDTMIMNFSFSYEDKYGRNYSNTSMITPKIDKSCVLEINSLAVAEKATVGAKALVNVRYSSTGALPVKNAVMIIDGNIIGGRKEVELSELLNNEQRTVDYYVNFSEAGEQVLTIGFQYFDENGTMYELEQKEFKVEVNNYHATATNEDSKAVSNLLDDENKKYVIIGVASFGVAILAIVVIIILKCSMRIQKKRRK